MKVTFSNIREFRKAKANIKGRTSKQPKNLLFTQKFELTAENIAVGKLDQYLRSFKFSNESIRMSYRKNLEKSDRTRYLNMKIMAEVIKYREMVNQTTIYPAQVNERMYDFENLSPGISDTINKLKKTGYNSLSDKEKVLYMRLFATFIRYFSFLNQLMNNPK